MKVIFLDVDGVLNSQRYFKERKQKGNDIDDTRVGILKKIIDKTNAEIVVSSTWRYSEDNKAALDRSLSQQELYIDSYTPIHRSGERADEVKEWLDKNKDVESFCILDDDHFNWEKYGFEKRWVQTSFYGGYGIENTDVERIIDILNGEKND